MLEQLQETSVSVAKAAEAVVWPLADDEVVDALRLVHRVEQTCAAVKARLVGAAVVRGIPATAGARTPVMWLRETLLMDMGPARELAGLAAALPKFPDVEQALIGARIDGRQAAAIMGAVAEIPSEVANRPAAGTDGGPLADTVADLAVGSLLEMAGEFPAGQFRVLGERVLERAAPEVAEVLAEERLRREERRARRRRHVTLSRPDEGVVHLSGALGVEDTATVSAALDPLCCPVKGDTRSAGQRRADALVDICRLALRTKELPMNGGQPAHVSVLVGYDPLVSALDLVSSTPRSAAAPAAGPTSVTGREALKFGTLDTGARISAGEVRRMGCDATILPLILGGPSQILDAGRSRRLASGPLRAALNLRDRGCAFPACDRHVRWCDAHHIVSWLDGGSTDLDNLVLLCRYHHGIVHEASQGWTIRLGDDRLPDFYPPPIAGRARPPRRNVAHLQT